MRIALVNWTSRLAGGAEQYVRRLAPALTGAGHAVALWSETGEPAAREPLLAADDGPTWSVQSLGADAAVQALREWKPDLLYCHGLEDPVIENRLLDVAPAVFFAHGYYGTCISGAKTWRAPAAVPCSRRFGWPCLLHFYPHRCGGLSPLTMLGDYRRQGTRLHLLRRYRAIITHSRHMRDEYLRHGFPGSRVHALPFPVADAPGDGPAPRTLPGAGPRRLVFIGRMDDLKGGEFLLRSLPAVRAGLRQPVAITFAGDGPKRPAWEALATSLTGADSGLTIAFAGWLDRPGVIRLLDASDLLVVPSVWPEPFGQVGPEAGLRGVPAAAFAVGGIPDWLEDGVSGFLAPGTPPRPDGLANAIVRSLESAGTYARLSRGATVSSRRYTMSAHLPALLPILGDAA